MLVLSRRKYESVVVGGSGGRIEQILKVTVLEINGRSVRLGFEVADDMPVHREEVWHRLRARIQPNNTPLDAQQGGCLQ
jgi:carbon storage regulator CsrA